MDVRSAVKLHLLGYTLVFGEKGSSETMSMVELNATVLNYTLSTLMPNTLYTVRLWAETHIGPGPIVSADFKSTMTPGNILIITLLC